MGARTENLRDLAFDQLTRQRLLHLIADGHLAAGLEQAADVIIRRVKRDAAHGHRAPLGQRHVEQLRPGQGVVEKHFVKVAQPKEQQGLFRQFALDAAILRHHRGELGIVGHWPERLAGFPGRVETIFPTTSPQPPWQTASEGERGRVSISSLKHVQFICSFTPFLRRSLKIPGSR